MIAVLDAFREANPGIDVKDSTLQWGSPFYTKLAMAAAGNRAPAGLPLIIVFVFFQRQIVAGVAHTGLAGQ